MRFSLVFKTLSVIWLILAFFMFLCSLTSLYYNEISAFKSFQITIIIIASISLLFLLLIKKSNQKILSTKGSFLLVSLAWITASFFGAMPFYLSGAIPHFTNAFFETASGFTTTGASILVDIESLPKSLLMWRSLTQWLGGMGIVVLTVAILPLLGIGGLQLIKAEAPGPSVDKISYRITTTAKYLWLIYLSLTVLLIALLVIGGMSFFDSVTHTFSTLSTGGFSPKQNSIAHYGSPFIQYVIAFFMFLASANFALHFNLITGNFKNIFNNSEFKAFIIIILTSTVIVTLNLYYNFESGGEESFRLAIFQALSFITTTGFVTDNYESWPFLSQIILFSLMFVGGCSGSTAGGIKVVRILLLFKQSLNEMKFLLHPRGIFTIKLNKMPVKKDIVYAVSGFFFLYIATNIIVTVIVASGGNSLMTSLTASLATIGNIGPAFGSAGPMDNYAGFSDYIKWVLSLAMIAGRLELYSFIIIFTPYFWKK
ncbi:potassium uptake protein, TrkH family [Flexistipes sinusarabici DSM 4947]|uniref:Potassium uptake protein, TrkH family n=1 Tax=Flexistipes sinusarabici (strain ATCC 49648 / DSM 4947 / MAS 10) TaxID=717231 RepID=F8E7R3_FLESM|nr:potassium transporter TrkG [Flexistipes sinusarabici]AEI13908.1 potassium uptake protein, TrkH family [Flexistipes sinusarabici DSM 4947]